LPKSRALRQAKNEGQSRQQRLGCPISRHAVASNDAQAFALQGQLPNRLATGR
jgi:hypothetical protein